MKKMLLSILIIIFCGLCQAQTVKTVKPDSTQVDKIEKMPMDTSAKPKPVKPVNTIYNPDTLFKVKSVDDADPDVQEKPKMIAFRIKENFFFA